MDFKALCFFIAVYEARNVSRASVFLGRVQSSVSLRLIALERSVGTRLFERRPHGLEPTDAGNRLYSEMKPVVDLFYQKERNFKPARAV